MTEPERERDRETVVVSGDGGGGGGSAGLIAGIAIAALVIFGVIWFVNVNTGGDGGTVEVDVPAVEVEAPAVEAPAVDVTE